MRGLWRLLGFCMLCALALPTIALAHENYVPQGPFVLPAPGSGVPTPTQVTGKEYANAPNLTSVPTPHAAAPGQTLLWDGIAGVRNGFAIPVGAAPFEVDAMAVSGDALFSAVTTNQAALIFSTVRDTYQSTSGSPIIYETIAGGQGLWASWAQVSHTHGNDPTYELTALEVWGPENAADTDRYSLLGEPGGISVFDGTGATVYTQVQIANAIGAASKGISELQIDLDGLMVFGSQLMFSIRPIVGTNGFFDGGEIWVWDGANPATFLNHGGHLWDTAFDVSGTFGTNTEDVDALEAVATPEPGTIALVSLGALGLFRGLRRRK